MKQNHKKSLKIFSIIFACIIIVLAALGAWLYTGKLTAAKIKLLGFLPYPSALVNGHFVSESQFVLRYNLSQKMLGIEAVSQKESQLKTAIISQLIEEEKTRQVAQKYGVEVSAKELDSEYQLRAGQSDLGGYKNFEELLKSYGLTPLGYKNEVLKPELMSNNLKIWHNAQKDLNKEAFDRAEGLLARIQKGEDMAVLAAAFSEDANGKAVGGDSGFVDTSQLLSELREPVEGIKTGEAKIISSRFGLHITKVEEKNGNKIHLRQIFLKASDFTAWYNQEVKNFSVKQLITI